ncbi:LON peptidase substrate-binding domain-containing protein [soil metagenome]
MKELPLFPLNGIVLFPGSLLPLHIFEPKYRSMLEDVIQGDRRFGVINVSNDDVTADVGCIAEIVQVEKFGDGSSNIISVGVERFKVVRKLETSLYPRAFTQIVKENASSTELETDLTKVASLLTDVFHLMGRLNRAPADASLLPKDPKVLSFWIASWLPTLPETKQSLLEIRDTKVRLAREISILDDFRNQLRVRVAIEDVFENVR